MFNFLLYLFAASWPLLSLVVLYDPGAGLPAIDCLRPFAILLLLSTLYQAFVYKQRLQLGKITSSGLLFLVFFSLGVFVHSTTSSLSLTVASVVDLYLVPLALYISIINRHHFNYRTFLFCLLISASFIAVTGIAEFMAGRNLLGPASRLDVMVGFKSHVYRVNGPFYDIIGYSGVLLLFLPVCYYAYKEKVVGSVAHLLINGLIISGSLLAFSRATMLALFLVLFILLVEFKLLRFFLISYICLLLFAIAIFIADQLTSTSFFSERIADMAHVKGRWDQYLFVLRLFVEHPFVGIGFGQYLKQFHIQIHNSYLRFLLEFGLLGFIPYMGFICSIIFFNLRKMLTSPSSPESKISWGLVFIVLLVSNTVDLLSNSHFMLALLMIVGFCQGYWREQAEEREVALDEIS